MGNWWVTWSNGRTACFYGEETEVRGRAAKATAPGDGSVVSVQELPYPASPQVGPKSSCPPFCFTPQRCVGKTACPRDHACND